MEIQADSKVPIYIQIAEQIEDLILEGKIPEETQAPSTNQLAALFKLNPATARKGLNILTEENILYKKRGLGMYVSEGAVKLIKAKRKKVFVERYVNELIRECKKLDIGIDEVIEMIKENEWRVNDGNV